MTPAYEIHVKVVVVRLWTHNTTRNNTHCVFRLCFNNAHVLPYIFRAAERVASSNGPVWTPSVIRRYYGSY